LLAANELCAAVISLRPISGTENTESNTSPTIKRNVANRRNILKALRVTKKFEDVLSQHNYTSRFCLVPFDSGANVEVRHVSAALDSFLNLCINSEYENAAKVNALLSNFWQFDFVFEYLYSPSTNARLCFYIVV
jgi:hypothetical protein